MNVHLIDIKSTLIIICYEFEIQIDNANQAKKPDLVIKKSKILKDVVAHRNKLKQCELLHKYRDLHRNQNGFMEKMIIVPIIIRGIRIKLKTLMKKGGKLEISEIYPYTNTANERVAVI